MSLTFFLAGNEIYDWGEIFMGNMTASVPTLNTVGPNPLPQVTKNPSFSKAKDIHQENLRRDIAITRILNSTSESSIRSMIRTSLGAGRQGQGVAPGTIIPISEKYLIRPEDEPTLRGLMESYKNPLANPEEIKRKINELLARGSDYIRATVAKAAQWCEVPPALVAVALQWENNLTDRVHHGLQTIERDLTTLLDRLNLPFGGGSTGLGNVKLETLNTAVANFEKYYKRAALPAGIPNVGRGQQVETDICHVALVIRDCLNYTWSQGATSLRESESGRYRYYPYFGGELTTEDVTRTIGRYNGFGDGARSYGENAANFIASGSWMYFLEMGRVVIYRDRW